MESTSGSLPVCVYCGTPRPADESSCPTCGRAWIDVKVEDVAADTADSAGTPIESSNEPDDDDITDELAATVAPAAAMSAAPPPPSLDDTGEFSFDDWTLPPEKPPSRARWIVPILLLLAVIAVWVVVFVDRGSSPTTSVAATDTTEATTTSEAQSTTTTVPETTTTAPETTTTVAIPPPSVWPPIGDPIPVEDLTLRAAGIGPIDIGSGVGQVAGRLTASLGEAEASGTDGLCEPGEAYWLQWGELRAIFDGFGSGATFVSYRYEDIGSETSLGLTTLSGLALGDTVQDLQDIYSSFTITFEVIDGRDVFRLVDGSELLLWGPVTSTEPDGLVTGIYSPGPCVEA